MITVSVLELAKTSVLAGAVKGKQILSALISHLTSHNTPEIMAVSFQGVEVATGSFLREAILSFRTYCRTSHPNVYPVVANANEAVQEELEFVLKDCGEAFVICVLDKFSAISSSRVIGTLEEKQRITLDAVLAIGRADARDLLKKFSKKEDISITGWNNRLAALSAKGILMEFRQGKSKVYKPVLEGLCHGS